eukprot:362021-Chlamydomonas_euryale.AAC.1
MAASSIGWRMRRACSSGTHVAAVASVAGVASVAEATPASQALPGSLPPHAPALGLTKCGRQYPGVDDTSASDVSASSLPRASMHACGSHI